MRVYGKHFGKMQKFRETWQVAILSRFVLTRFSEKVKYKFLRKRESHVDASGEAFRESVNQREPLLTSWNTFFQILYAPTHTHISIHVTYHWNYAAHKLLQIYKEIV